MEAEGKEKKNVARYLSTPINSTDQNLLKSKYELGDTHGLDTEMCARIDISADSIRDLTRSFKKD